MKRLAKPGTVTAKFVGDDDVIENITTTIETKKRGKKRSDVLFDQSKADILPSTEEKDDDNYQPSTVLCMDEVEGKEIYQLTPQGKVNKAQQKSDANKKSSKKNEKMLKSTPKSNQKRSKQPNNIISDKKDDASRYSLRLRVKNVGLSTSLVDSDPENSDNDMSSDEDDDNETHFNNSDELMPLPSNSKKQDKMMRSMADNYFGVHKKTKHVTSNRTLAKITIPQTNIQGLCDIFQDFPEYHKNEKIALMNCYEDMFKKWDFFMQEGCSVLLFGVGSKHSVIQKFCSSMLEDELHIIVNGFFPSLTIKQILNSITEDLLDCEDTFPTAFEQAEYVKNHFNSVEEKLYIVIHNIDGQALRGTKNQAALSTLAAVPNIHIIASVDHINCPLIWDQIMLSQFKWLWYEVPTYEPYIFETSYENSMLRDRSSQLLLSSLSHVFRSLTTNGQGVFLILLKHQLSKGESSSYIGLSFQDWYQECREAFLVNSELTMNAQLSEFKNHKLLSSRKSIDGVEYWYIPANNITLAEFLEKEESR